jgi:hypothetical protein
MPQTRSSTRTAKNSGSSRPGASRSSRAKTNGRSNGSSRGKRSTGSSRTKTQASSRTKTQASSRTKPRASRRPRPQASPNGVADSVKGSADSLKDTVTSGASEITTAARKAKVPLIASGVTLAGAAVAAVVTKRSGKRRRVLGISMPRRNGLKVDARKSTGVVSDAAKRADHFGRDMSRVANSVQKVSETADEAVKKT